MRNWGLSKLLKFLVYEIVIFAELLKINKYESVKDEICSLNKIRSLSKRFSSLINDKYFVKIVINFLAQKYKKDRIYIALMWSSSESIKWILENGKPEEINKFLKDLLKDKKSLTSALIQASVNGCIELIELLINNGAKINLCSLSESPLCIAIKSGRINIIKLKLQEKKFRAWKRR